MRRLAGAERVRQFLRELGKAASRPARVYLTGGSSAVLLGWRATTIDIDLELVPDHDELLRAIASLKEKLEINVEIVSPAHFIPALPGWRERSVFISQEGRLTALHYDFYAQALAKIERGHTLDRADVHSMFAAGLVQPQRLRELFAAITPELYRYPAIDGAAFERSLEEALRQL